MLENPVKKVHCDTYHPNISDSLVKSLGSYIDSVPDYERRTPEFITEVRRRLYFIHENNCQVAERTYMYPRTIQFDKLLIRYVELEFEVLHFTNQPCQKQIEVSTELRVLRLLQVMLYKTVLNNENNENTTDAILKKTVLELLGQVKSTYLEENKLIYNIINKLKTDTSNGKITSAPDLHKNLATSDYGTDDDSSDLENDIVNRHKEKLVPTVVFADDDDDDNYMVYLQKNFSSQEKNSIAKTQKLDNDDSTCIVVCSDSDDETNESSSNAQKRHTKKRNSKEKQERGVVTFEIIDDDDDDGLNYMVYLQKEVNTKGKSKNRNKKSTLDNVKEIVISDSEDEAEILDKTEDNKMIIVGNVNKYNEETTNNEEYPSVDDVQNIPSSNNDFFNDSNLIIDNESFPQDILPENMSIISFDENEIELNSLESPKSNFLINPAIIFDKMPDVVELPEDFITKPYEKSETASFGELEADKLNSPGGPVLSEKMDDLDLDNLLECRLNDSLLEEILLNDSYILESQKEFEDLECFLFDDKKEPRINFLVENDEILQNELNKNDFFMEQNPLFESISNTKNWRSKPVPKTRGCNKRSNRSSFKTNPLKDFTNNNHQTGKNFTNENCDLVLGKELKYCRHRRENSFKTTCRGKHHAFSRR